MPKDGELIMPVVYDKLLALMKERQITTYVMRQTKLIHADTYTNLKKREGGLNHDTLNRVCEALQVQPGDICEFISDEECRRRNEADKAEAERIAAEKAAKREK